MRDTGRVVVRVVLAEARGNSVRGGDVRGRRKIRRFFGRLLAESPRRIHRSTMDPFSENSFERMAALAKELEGESDRAAAIVGAAWVEEALGAAVESILHPHKKARDRLFGRSGPLATFAAKIDLATLFGFIDEAIRLDLDSIRDVRNVFAHDITHKVTHAALGFGSDSIKGRCLALRCVAHLKLSDPREAFIRACASLNAELYFVPMLSSKISGTGRVYVKGYAAS